MWLQIIVLHIEKKGKIATNCCNAVNFFQCKLGQHWRFNQRFQGKSFPFWYFQSVYASYANLKISNMDAFVAPFSPVLLSTEKIWNARKAGIFRDKFEDPETFWILPENCVRARKTLKDLCIHWKSLKDLDEILKRIGLNKSLFESFPTVIGVART